MFALAYARLVDVARAVLLGTRVGQQQCGAAVLRQVNWGFSLGTLGVMRALLLRRMVSALVATVDLCTYDTALYGRRGRL